MAFFLEVLPDVPDAHVRNTGAMGKRVISQWAFGGTAIDDNNAEEFREIVKPRV